MFQTFEATTTPDQGPPRLAALRDWMSAQNLDGFLVPRADRHQGEYVADCDARLAWLTGFTGSAGFACVLNEVAGVFIDGRYRIQVTQQVADDFTPVHWPETKLEDWLKETANSGDVIGFDPWLHTVAQIETAQTALDGSGIILKPVSNGVDKIWHDRPAPPKAKAWAHPIELSGQSSRDKIANLAKNLEQDGHSAAVITLPDSICWLLNVRGADVPCTPIVQAFAILYATGRVSLFADQSKFEDLGPDPLIDKFDWADFENTLSNLKGQVLIDPTSLPQAAKTALEKGEAISVKGTDPCALPKACKNQVELEGARTAHIRDGAAYVEFLTWLEDQDLTSLTEIDMLKALEGFRRNTNLMHDISFETISGSGPNGAIVHYRVTEASNRPLDADNVLLLDSGAQYKDGTTDITRTLPIGTPPLEIRQAFTRVLQGMIAVSKQRFPSGLTGRDLDSLARASLWAAGQDYDHGTGHGVGSFLSVHEGPQRISRATDVALKQGMILSNEPGYYRADGFGIRIENLIIVQDARTIDGGDDRAMLEFETLTFVPINTSIIETQMLTQAERDWLNTYHAEVLQKLSPTLSPSATQWLQKACAAI